MKRFLAFVLVLGVFLAATVGCVEKSSNTKETDGTTPGETTTVICQQQSESDARQPGVFRGQQQNGANGQQHDRSKDQKQSLSDGKQQGAADGQHESGSKDQKESRSDRPQPGAAQDRPLDDSTKKEKK
jgi:hypothetical protein